MVSEWEQEELGRLTGQRFKPIQPLENEEGKITQQRLESLKGAQRKGNTHEAKIKIFLDRLRMSVVASLAGLFAFKPEHKGSSMCELYGHNWPSGRNWQGLYPKCLDCGKEITDPGQLRGAMTKEDRARFRT